MDEHDVIVTPARRVEPQSYDLSTLDQITLRFYHRLLLFFRRNDAADPRQIFSHLECGLSELLAELPAFGGEIVTDISSSRLHLEHTSEPEIVLHYRDLRDEWSAGTFDELEEAGFPMSRIGSAASMLIGQPGVPTAPRVPNTDAVASFIPGGMVLGISWHHAFTGVEGRSIFLERWSKHITAAAQGTGMVEPIKLSANAWDRSLLSRPAADKIELPIWLRLKDVSTKDSSNSSSAVATNSTTSYGSNSREQAGSSHQSRSDTAASRASQVSEHLSSPQNAEVSPRLVASYWRISATNLMALKATASRDDSKVSTSDALCALAWRSITRARKAAGGRFEQSMLAIATDVRHRVPELIPPDYIGYAAAFATPVATTGELCEDDPSLVSRLALLVRHSLQRIDKSHVNKLLGSITAKTNPNEFVFNVDLPGGDVVISNQLRTNTLDLWWGPHLGSCAAVRLAAAVVPGSCNFMSQNKKGDIEILTVLTADAAQALREDVTFTKYARFVSE